MEVQNSETSRNTEYLVEAAAAAAARDAAKVVKNKAQGGIPEPKHGAERSLNVAVVAVLQVCQHDDDWKYWCRQTALAVQRKHSGSRGEKPRAAQNHSKSWQNNTKCVGKIQ